MWAVRTIVQAIALATTGALLGLGVNALRPAGVSLLRPWVGDNDATAECALASADPVRIDAVAAMRLLATHAAVFGDVRGASEYAAGHVVDAVHLPCSAEAPEWLVSLWQGRPRACSHCSETPRISRGFAHALRVRASSCVRRQATYGGGRIRTCEG